MNSAEAFRRPFCSTPSTDRSSVAWSLGIHGGVILLVLLAGVLFRSSPAPIVIGGGTMVSVEMVVLEPVSDSGSIPNQHEQVVPVEEQTPVETPPVEVVQHQVPDETLPVEAVEQVETIQQVVPDTPVTPVETPPVETLPQSQFITVGASGEPGFGAPGPASYEGRVFAAIRRNFVTSTEPPLTYRIHFTVNTDGTHRWEVVRRSGNPAFDRAVEHALETASIPPMPPGRTTPVRLSIEFLGPD